MEDNLKKKSLDYDIHFRVTESEKEDIAERAKRKGRTSSNYIRRVLFKK